jgi:hypothetical protein
MASIEDFLEMFNNGDLDVPKYFGDYSVWFNVLKKRGLMDEIDPHNASDNEVWQNEYLLWLYDSNRENYYKWITQFLEDVIIEDGKAFWEGERSELSELFCDGSRYDMSRDTVSSILAGDDVFEPYWDTTDDVYRDVIEELNKENLETFKERLLKELSNKQLSPETNEMELIASEQGHDDYWELTIQNVTRILDDEESMNSLLSDELSDIKSDLYSIHSNAYNSAYESEVYDDIFKELEDYFDTKNGKWSMVPHPYKKNTQIEKYRLPIHDLEGIINDYLYNNKGYGNQGTIEYWGSLIGIIKEEKDCLSVRSPDYPDSRKVDENINEYFKDHF